MEACIISGRPRHRSKICYKFPISAVDELRSSPVIDRPSVHFVPCVYGGIVRGFPFPARSMNYFQHIYDNFRQISAKCIKERWNHRCLQMTAQRKDRCVGSYNWSDGLCVPSADYTIKCRAHWWAMMGDSLFTDAERCHRERKSAPLQWEKIPVTRKKIIRLKIIIGI